MKRRSNLAVGLSAILALMISSTALGDARAHKTAGETTLLSICNARHFQAVAPAGVRIQNIPNASLSVATKVKTTGGVVYVPAGTMNDNAPEYCIVTGSAVTNPLTGKTANFGAAFPAPRAWNQRVLMQGCGGLCGEVFDNGPPSPSLMRRGYAVWTTDDGHVDPAFAQTGHNLAADSSWAIVRTGEANADAISDYADRAVHVVAQLAKEFSQRLYGTNTRRSYFIGCSDGGREAMQEASLHPEDFDGIVAGSPFLDPAGTVLGSLSAVWAQLQSQHAGIPAAKFDAIARAIVRTCDEADGVKDGLVQNPAACDFSPLVDIPKCNASTDADDCLLPEQLKSAAAIFSGVRDLGGNVIAPGIATVSTGLHEGGWGLARWVGFPFAPERDSGPYPFGLDPSRGQFFWAWSVGDGMVRHFTFLGDQKYSGLSDLHLGWDSNSNGTVIPGHIVRRIRNSISSLSDANPYQLANYIAQSRRLIIWHGFADGSLGPYITSRYYNQLAALHGGYKNLQKSVKLFMAPDVAHCGWGGEGPNAFQTLYHNVDGELPPPVMDAEHDMLMALEHWVEDRVEPIQIIASRYLNDDPTQRVVRSMPLCPFPAQAKFRGIGDVMEASSWQCPSDDERLLKVGAFGSAAGITDGPAPRR